jgi:hypothetical protein
LILKTRELIHWAAGKEDIKKTGGSRWIEFHSQQVHLKPKMIVCSDLSGAVNTWLVTTRNALHGTCPVWLTVVAGLNLAQAAGPSTQWTHIRYLKPTSQNNEVCPPLLMYLRMFRMQFLHNHAFHLFASTLEVFSLPFCFSFYRRSMAFECHLGGYVRGKTLGWVVGLNYVKTWANLFIYLFSHDTQWKTFVEYPWTFVEYRRNLIKHHRKTKKD